MGESLSNGQVHLAYEGEIAVITLDNPPVNSSTDAVRRGILSALASLDVKQARAVVLTGTGRNLMAGADLRELENEPTEPTLPQVTSALEACPLPVIAVIKGHTLGGGLELALACDVRLATASASLGLPEVTVGIIPGAGGTQRLPRAVGLGTALEMIVSGKPIKAAKALELGLVDHLLAASDNEAQHAEVLCFARNYQGGKQPLSALSVVAEDKAALRAQAQKLVSGARGLPAAAVAAEVVLAADEVSFKEAVAKERAAFLDLRGSQPALALRYLFFAERAEPYSPSQPTEARVLERVAVIGAGTMGSGIALCALQAGYAVDLFELNAQALKAGIKRIESELARDVDRQRLAADQRDAILARLTSSQDIQTAANADLVIEAIIEDMAAKQALFAQLAERVSADTLLATNTSYLDIDKIAAGIPHPERVLGLHFFSPAHRMSLLEVVRGSSTGEQTLCSALKFAERLKKKAVVVSNAWGFVGNRLYAAYRRQCEFMLEEGASPEQVDAAIEQYGFAMGPFKVADMSGLDIAWRMRQQTAEARHLRRYVGIPDLICEAGRLGRKTAKGYYRYGEDNRPQTDNTVTEIIAGYRREKGIEAKAFSDEEIQQRALLALINEALLLLGEGVCQRPEDVDIALVHGYGFPRWRGGPVFIARSMGLSELNAALDGFVEVSGKGQKRGNASLLLPNALSTKE
ncbi:3-hydroxyacyl-CoA dehydrogenase NAD-binding domain-containing protein [Pseudomonas fluorescens]|uniref:Enoyl-CoA hydratase/isomerase family protein n=1 Tax=Pseudomonas fluorescens TaxID=294 RepID=A0A944HIJ7_PSEFL|nr:3-hydroxyacyl-CoA dehydrogenase NAD-binding domain-containing protein [Pseudomonas fluorescens]MBT2295322.1 enoyl-CoA hydratase/isomerase family protein [Pseudomonas fluorescens]MBT2308998.1 enoyl-CoA hydratase/isomerase family protein [Pseudomonas fluorescens]MBT2312249.1 enoyl-CoA hydratase/isomerase family protein [Pseudomonas fluorescens]MBT2318184.1 enoyl-CoA hydratase/isomerase family protein [Pseudomonas fluorescens]MBT2332019.1 enoyl-CoA hydratase/isomerase family protein [Pseudomon